MRTLTLVLFVALFQAGILTASAEPELSGSPGELGRYLSSVPGQIALTATAEIKAEANRAVLELRVNTKEKLLQTALEKNRKIRDEIVQALTAHGLDKDAIRIAKFSSTPTYGWFGKKPATYEINNTVEVRALNENDVQAIAELIDKLPEVSLDSMHFEHTDKEQLKLKAVAEALDKLNVQKKAYEEKLGVTLRAHGVLGSMAPLLGGVMAGSGMSSPQAYTANTIVNGGTVGGLAASAPDVQDVSQFDQVSYQAQITVIFDVLNKDTNK